MDKLINIMSGMTFSFQPILVNSFPKIPLFYMIFSNLLTIFLVNFISLLISNKKKKNRVKFVSFLKHEILTLSLIHFVYFYLVFISYRYLPVSVSDPIYITGTLLLPSFYSTLNKKLSHKMSYFNYMVIIGIFLLIITQKPAGKILRLERIIGILSLLLGVSLYNFLFSTNVTKTRTERIKNYKKAEPVEKSNIFLIESSLVGTIICTILSVIIIYNENIKKKIIGDLSPPSFRIFIYMSLGFGLISLIAYMSLYHTLQSPEGANSRLILSKTSELITSCVLGYFLLHERFTTYKLLGIAILLVAIYYFDRNNLTQDEKLARNHK